MPLRRMPSLFNSRSAISRQRLRPGEIGDGTVAQQLRVDYNALPPIGYVEGHHISLRLLHAMCIAIELRCSAP